MQRNKLASVKCVSGKLQWNPFEKSTRHTAELVHSFVCGKMVRSLKEEQSTTSHLLTTTHGMLGIYPLKTKDQVFEWFGKLSLRSPAGRN